MITAPRLSSFILIGKVFILALVISTMFTASKAAAGDDLLEAFDKTHAEITAQVKKGKLKAEVGAKANDLKLALKKYLIKTDAQLEILQLDVLYGSGEKQEASLNKIVAIAAERERVKMGYLQRLLALKGGKSGGKDDMLLLPVVPEQSKTDHEKDKAAGETTAKNEKGKSWTWKGIEIEIGPEKTEEMINRD
jgi:hypothetical protein